MYWLQRRRKEAGQGEQVRTPGQDHPRWLEARVEGEIPKSKNLVLEMGGGVRMLVGNRTQVALAGELLRATGSGRGMLSFSGSLRVFVAVEEQPAPHATEDPLLGRKRFVGTEQTLRKEPLLAQSQEMELAASSP